MEYTVKQLAKISGVSARTLRYYEEIGLLTPARISSNNYRIYGKNEVDALQQILFYRELEINLDEIKKLLTHPDYDKEKSLQSHLTALTQKKARIEKLIHTIGKSISALKGEIIMNDMEKFEGFKQSLIDENERKYGAEIREKYGDEQVDASNAKLMGLDEAGYAHVQNLSAQINETLLAAMATGDPSDAPAQKVCELHKEWLCMFWKEGSYSKEAHIGLGEMYVADERFKAYYDKIADGAAEFLRDALNVYCAE